MAGSYGEVLGLDGRYGFFTWCGFALVLWVGSVRLYNVTWVEIYPPSSVANATASPQGEAFFTPCIHSKYDLKQ